MQVPVLEGKTYLHLVCMGMRASMWWVHENVGVCRPGSQFRFHCSEFRFFDQSLTFIFLNLKPKSQTFQTEIRIPVFIENEKNH